MSNKFNLDGFAVDEDNVCTAEGGFSGIYAGQVTNYDQDGVISTNDVFATVSALGSQTDLDLPQGTEGQCIRVVCIEATNNTVITPDQLFGGTKITFDAVGEYAELVAVTTGWRVFSTTATVA
jgi:hypothetical protein